MITYQSTLQVYEDSVLVRQFDKVWTNNGCKNKNARVEEWKPDDVCDCLKTINGISIDAITIFDSYSITGRELLVLGREGLAMIGIDRPGTVCLL